MLDWICKKLGCATKQKEDPVSRRDRGRLRGGAGTESPEKAMRRNRRLRVGGYASSIAFNLAKEDTKRNAPESEKYIPEPVKVRHSKRCERTGRASTFIFLKRSKWRRSLLKF